MNKSEKEYVRFVSALSFAFLWMLLGAKSKMLSNYMHGTSFNLTIYMGMFFSFFISYIVITWIVKDKTIQFKMCTSRLGIIFNALLLYIVFVIFFLYEKKMFDAMSFYMPWHTSIYKEIAVCIVVLLASFVVYAWLIKKKTKKSRFVWLVYCTLAFYCSWVMYSKNFLNSFYDAYHIHAVFNSVYRVIHMQPYSELNTGVYGFYGILCGGLVKIIGGSFDSFILVLTAMTFLAVLSMMYALDILVEDTILKSIAAFGIVSGYIALQKGFYFQNFPLRHIFVAYTLACIAYTAKKNKKQWLKYVVASLAVVWNFETGVGCVLASVAFDIVNILQQKDESYVILKCLKKIMYLPFCIGIAYCIVNLYNIITGGGVLKFSIFLFPYIGSYNYMDAINCKLELFPSMWILVCFLFFSMITIVIRSTCMVPISDKTDKEKQNIVASIVVVGIVQGTYYINRTAYGNLYIILPVASVLLAYKAEHFYNLMKRTEDKYEKSFYRVLTTAVFIPMLLISFMTICRGVYLNQFTNDYKCEENIKKVKSIFLDEIPVNTFGYGIGIPEIYSELGWDSGIYVIDASDFGALSIENRVEVSKIIAAKQDILVEQGCLDEVVSNSPIILGDFYLEHELKFSYKIGDLVYNYYVHK